MATVQFSLNAHQLETLQRLSNPGESLNLTAKRVLVGILVKGNTSSSNIDTNLLNPEPTLETDITSTEWWLKRLDDRIKAIEIGIEANHYGANIESLEERIEKLETEVEILTTPKQPATFNNGESVIFLSDLEGKPIQFWSGQVWVDDLELAYRYKGAQAMARTMDKLKKRKFPSNGSLGTTIAFAPIENLLKNGES
jgi:hypothetical protein